MKKVEVRAIKRLKPIVESINDKLDAIESRNDYLLKNFENLTNLEYEWYITHKLLTDSMIYIQRNAKKLNKNELMSIDCRLNEIKFDIVKTMKCLNYFNFDEVLLIIKYCLSIN